MENEGGSVDRAGLARVQPLRVGKVKVGSARGAWAARRSRLAWFPPAATSNRACGSLAHGSPTLFTVGIQLARLHDRFGRGAMMVPLRLISRKRFGVWARTQ